MFRYVTRAAVVAGSVAGLLWVAASPGTATSGQERQFVVLYAQGGSAEAAHAAIAAAGGTVISENAAIGVAGAVDRPGGADGPGRDRDQLQPSVRRTRAAREGAHR